MINLSIQLTIFNQNFEQIALDVDLVTDKTEKIGNSLALIEKDLSTFKSQFRTTEKSKCRTPLTPAN